MSIPAFFKKLNKKTKDLLDSKDFDLQRTYKYKTTSLSGVEFATTFKLSADATDASGKLKASYKSADYGEGSVEVDTGDLVDASYTSKELIDGLKVVVSTKANRENTKDGKSGMKCNLAVEGQYTRENFAGKLRGELVKPIGEDKDELEVTATATIGVDKVTVGGLAKYACNDIAAYDFGLKYDFEDAVAVLQATKKLKQFTGSYYHKVSSAVTVGTQLDVSVKTSGDSREFTRAVSAGFEHEVDESSKIKVLFSKPVAANGNLTLSGLYASKINSSTKLSLATVVDLQQLKGGDHQFGIQLENGDL